MLETGNNILTSPSINLIDETFDVSQSDNCYLVIQTDQNGLSFCIFNTVINKYIVLRHYMLNNPHDLVGSYRSIFESDDLLKLRYKSSNHILISPLSTLIPDHLFNPLNAKAYLNFNHGWEPDRQVAHNHISATGLSNVFSYPDALSLMLRIYQPNITFCHHATPLIHLAASEAISSMKPKITIYYYDGYLDIVIVKTGKLLFYNTFKVDIPDDFIYYLAAVLNLFHIDITTASIAYAGSIKELPPSAGIIQKYTAGLRECNPCGSAIYSHYLTEQLKAKYAILFSLQCAL